MFWQHLPALIPTGWNDEEEEGWTDENILVYKRCSVHNCGVLKFVQPVENTITLAWMISMLKEIHYLSTNILVRYLQEIDMSKISVFKIPARQIFSLFWLPFKHLPTIPLLFPSWGWRAEIVFPCCCCFSFVQSRFLLLSIIIVIQK